MSSNTQQLQSGQTTQTLPPEFTQGLNFLLNQSQSLADAPLTPELSAQTLGAIPNLGQINPITQQAFESTATGDPTRFNVAANLDDPSLRAAAGFAAESAAQRVGDVFTAAGRTGSPANALAVSRGVGQAVSPFTFQAIQNAENRNFQATQAERARQLNAAGQLQNLTTQQTRGQLEGGQLLDAQQARLLGDPFERLRLLSSPILGAASAAPRTQTTTSPFTTNDFLTGLGGATSLLGLGNALFPSGGGGVGNAALDVLGLGGGAALAGGLGGTALAGGATAGTTAGLLGGTALGAGAGIGATSALGGSGAALAGGAGALTAPGALTPGAVSISPLAAPTAAGGGTAGGASLLGGAAALAPGAFALFKGLFDFPSGTENVRRIEEARQERILEPILEQIQSQIPGGVTQEEFNASRQPPTSPLQEELNVLRTSGVGDQSFEAEQINNFFQNTAQGQALMQEFFAANPQWFNPDGSRTDFAGPLAPPLSEQRALAEATF